MSEPLMERNPAETVTGLMMSRFDALLRYSAQRFFHSSTLLKSGSDRQLLPLCHRDEGATDAGKASPVSGYSLVELLVVMGVIGLLLAFAAPSLFTNQSLDLNGASLRVSTYFEQARAQAAAMGVPVRVLIHEDRTEPGQFLQRAILVRQREEPDGNVSWEQVLNPVMLPEGVYFDFTKPGTSSQVMRFGEGQERAHEWRFYEIRGSGVPSGNERNVILSPGIWDSSDLEPTFPKPENFVGFRISNSARMIPYHNGAKIIATDF